MTPAGTPTTRHRLTALLGALAIAAAACGGGAADETAAMDAETATSPPASEPEPVVLDFSEVGRVVGDHVAGTGLNGAGLVVVDADDGVVYEDYWGEFDADRVSLVASSSKQITAVILLRLHQEGVLDVDRPIVEIVGDAWGDDGDDLGDRTIAQMVSNSSGLVGLAPNPAYPPYLCQFLADEEIESCARAIYTTPNDDDDLVAPDTEYRYGGAQWQLAGGVAEVASGERWDALVQRILVEPCGLGDDFGYTNHWLALVGAGLGYPANFDGRDLSILPDTGNPHMEGGVYVTTPDYAELLLLHLRGGDCRNGSVLSPETLAIAHRDRAEEWGGDAGQPDTGYGYGWFHDRTTGRLSDPGAYGSVAWLDLDDGYGAYLVLEAGGGRANDEFASELEMLIHNIMTS